MMRDWLVDPLSCDVLGKLQMRGARPFLLGHAKCLSDTRRDVCTADELLRVLRQRPHHVDDIDDLELPLLAGLDRLLSGEHQHRHAAELRIGGGGDEIRRTRAERRQTDAGASGQPAVGRGHESCGLLVPRQDEPNRV